MESSSDVPSRILDAAAEVFARKGFDGAKVEDIARAAGVNKAGLYYHVGNKEKLYETVLATRFAAAADFLEAALAAARPDEDIIRVYVAALARAFAENPLLPRMMVQELASGAGGLTPAVLGQILRVVACTQKAFDRRRQGDAGRPAPILFAHLALAGPLALFVLSASFRKRLASDNLSVPSSEIDRPLTELADFLADLFAPNPDAGCPAPRRPDPAGQAEPAADALARET